MDNTFGNAFMVEMKDFFAEMEIFKGGWAARADFERIVIVGDRAALGGGEIGMAIFSGLMQFFAFAPAKALSQSEFSRHSSESSSLISS